MMARPKPGQAQFRNQYDEDCPHYCCTAKDQYKLTNNIFFWLQAFLNHASSSRFKAPQRAVLVAVYSFWSPKRPVCTATQHTIARRAGCQRSTVQKTLALAVKEGWLTETKKTGRSANEYSPKVPSTFYRGRSTPIGNDSDAEPLTQEEMREEVGELRERIEKTREANLAGHHVRPLPAGKHLSDLNVIEVFGRDKGLTPGEIVHHALADPKFVALIGPNASDPPSAQQILNIVHDAFNSNSEDDFEKEDESAHYVEEAAPRSRRRKVKRLR